MDPDQGAPDPLEGGDSPADWAEEDGPFYAWLPPEDRLWRHPSERTAARPERAPSRRWTGVLPRGAIRSTWAFAVLAGLVGAGAATGLGMATGVWRDTTVVRSVEPSTSVVSLADIGPAPVNWTAIDDSVSDSVVTIAVNGAAGPEVGSGMVILVSGAGDAYVVADRSLFARAEAAGYLGPIEVTFLSGSSVRARLLGTDVLSGLALVEISGPDAAAAVPANLGTVATLHQADQVMAVGSRTAPSVSTGSVSGEDRTVALTDGSDVDGLIAVAMPQLSSTGAGGPLLDQ
ncbi:MAG TPA: S1C family serine protease, partial [Acidimicrobiales bacterium]|nr:S1C family serine protease [Acidimicrobiales bacterium]